MHTPIFKCFLQIGHFYETLRFCGLYLRYSIVCCYICNPLYTNTLTLFSSIDGPERHMYKGYLFAVRCFAEYRRRQIAAMPPCPWQTAVSICNRFGVPPVFRHIGFPPVLLHNWRCTILHNYAQNCTILHSWGKQNMLFGFFLPYFVPDTATGILQAAFP